MVCGLILETIRAYGAHGEPQPHDSSLSLRQCHQLTRLLEPSLGRFFSGTVICLGTLWKPLRVCARSFDSVRVPLLSTTIIDVKFGAWNASTSPPCLSPSIGTLENTKRSNMTAFGKALGWAEVPGFDRSLSWSQLFLTVCFICTFRTVTVHSQCELIIISLEFLCWVRYERARICFL